MWNALRSDIAEFATSIASDSTTVLETIDTKLKETVPGSKENGQQGGGESKLAGTSATTGDGDDYNAQGEGGELNVTDDGTSDNDDDMSLVYAEAVDEALKRQEMEDVYFIPLLSNEVNGTKTESSEIESSPVKAQAEEGDTAVTEEVEGDKSDGQSDTAADVDAITVTSKIEPEAVEEDDPDVAEVKEYLRTFDIQSKTEEISEILAKYPDTVGHHFESLVPIYITYEQFWQRYFFRCDPERIRREWEEEDELASQKRQELIDKGVKSVQNIFGGAFKAIKGVANQDDRKGGGGASIYEKYQAELEEKQRAMMDTNSTDGDKKEDKPKGRGLGLGFFSGGRPPFVMNTAESDNEDETIENAEQEEEDEESEEELSWGTDDEEEYEEFDEEEGEDEGSVGANESEQEIVFGSPEWKKGAKEELESLRQELSQTTEERDQLHKTVEMQSKELSNLKGSTSEQPNSDSEKERLEMIIFEKDSELAALKATLDDTDEDGGKDKKSEAKINEQAKEIDIVRVQMTKKDDELSALRVELAKMQSAEEEMKSKHELLSGQFNEVEAELARSKADLENQISQLMNQVSVAGESSSEETKALQLAQIGAQDTIRNLSAQLEEALAGRLEAENKARVLGEELQDSKTELKKQSVEFEKTLENEISKVRAEKVAPSLPSPSEEGSSLSSAVEIPVVDEHNAQETAVAADDEDGGWGDSWSDED